LTADRTELKLVPAAGGPEHKIADTREQPWFAPRRLTAAAWSPDGGSIAVSHREADDHAQAIYLFSLTGQKRRLTMPVWSKNQKRFESET
jgi:Tol biopolymer transport system component